MKNKILEMNNKGYKLIEIAKELNIPYGTVKSVISRNKVRVEGSSIRIQTPPIVKEYGHCKHCGKELSMVEGKKEKIFCSGYCRLKFWRNKNGKGRKK